MATGWDLMVIPFSRSRSIASSNWALDSRSVTVLVNSISRSESVVFPWSMWAMIEKLRVRDVGMAGRELSGGRRARMENRDLHRTHGKRKRWDRWAHPTKTAGLRTEREIW